MKADICNDLTKCRIILVLTALSLFLGNNVVLAQNTPIYKDGNVAVYQYSHGWEIMHGGNLVGYGDGVLDMETIPPAFKDLIDFYAVEPVSPVTKRPKTKAAPTLSEEYGPLIKTKWFQRSPYNDLFPEIPDGSGVKQHALVGCTSVSSGMMMNFFHYCKPFLVKGTNTIEGISPNLVSPFISNVRTENKNDKIYVTFDYDFAKQYSSSLYTPDFEEINSDSYEVSKYLLAIAFVQQAGFGLDVTLTFRDKQMNAIENLYGYHYDSYNYKTISGLDLNYNNVIADAIKKGWPVIVGGQTSEGSGHSYIIDGYDGELYHFEYGWGGKDNGWFAVPAKYAHNYNFIIAHPDIEDFTYLKPNPKYLCVKGVGNNFNKKIEMKQSGSNKWSYCQKEPVDLPAGTYEYYFEYADGSKLAPYTSSTLQLDYDTSPFSWTGLFTTNPAKIKLTKGYKLNFWHKLNQGEVMIEGLDFHVAISGKVLDLDNNPVAGAMVTYYDACPVIVQEETYEITNKYYSVPKYPSWRKNTFVSSANCLAGMDIRIHSKKGNPGDLIVAILDYTNKEVWKKQIPYSQVVTGQWMHIDFDETVFVAPSDPYYVALASEEWESGTNTYYTSCDEEHNISYRIYSSDIPFINSRSDGSYSCSVDKYSSLTLSAFSKDMVFNTLEFENVTEDLTEQNIVQTGFTFVDISGSVLDKDNQPIAGAVVTTAATPPEPVVDNSNPTPSDNGYRAKVEGVLCDFVPTVEYLSQLDIMMFYEGDPGKLYVSLLDNSLNTLWTTSITTSQIQGHKTFTQLKFDNLVKVVPGENYYIKLSADVCNDDNRYNYYYDATNKRMVYQVWGCDDYYTYSGSDGKYVYRTDGGFTGQLHAFFEDKAFGTVSLTEQYVNISNMNFVENGESIVVVPNLVSISVQKPTKTLYVIGDSFDPTGMIVKANYDNGSFKPLTSGYVLSGFDSNTEGTKTITVKYGEFTTTFTVKVGNVVEYSLTFLIDGQIYGDVEYYQYGDAVTMRADPVKNGYKFKGWDQVITSMPDYDVVIDGSFD